MRRIWIQAPVLLTTKNEIGIISYALFLITAMRPIWRLSDGLSINIETLMIKGAWQEFHIKTQITFTGPEGGKNAYST